MRGGDSDLDIASWTHFHYWTPAVGADIVDIIISNAAFYRVTRQVMNDFDFTFKPVINSNQQ